MGRFRADPLRFLMDVHEKCGDVARFRMAHQNCYLLRHPNDVHHVLVENHANYGKQTVGYEKMRQLLGNGLVTSEGSFWKRQRRIAQPGFHRKRIEAFANTMATMADEMVDGWLEGEGQGGVRDVSVDMMAVTLRIVANTVLSVDVAARETEIGDAVTVILEVFDDSVRRIFPVHEHLPTATNKRWEAARNFLDQIVYGIIDARRKPGEVSETDDLLDMLMNAVDEESGETMTDVQLRDEVMTMFMAGHETTANALTFALYELARHPDTMGEVQAEVDRVLGSRRATLEDLAELELCGRVMNEAMRIHPPIWLLARNAKEDDQMGPFRIRKGSIVFLSPYATHRHPAFWPEPQRFDPDRFLPEAVKARPKYAFYPFSGGPRVCIGNHFAEMEAKLILAAIAQRCTVALDESTRVDYDPSVTLRPRGGLRLKVRPRSS